MATVATRPLATRAARVPPAMSIWDSTQPPKISPLPFMSAGCGIVRTMGSRWPAVVTSEGISSTPDIVDFPRFSYHTDDQAAITRSPRAAAERNKNHGQKRRSVRALRRRQEAIRAQGQFLYRARYRGA